jgi:hypothetical protein
MTYHRVCDKSNTMGATWGAGTAYPSGKSKFTPSFSAIGVLFGVLYIIVCSFVVFVCHRIIVFFNLRLLSSPLISSYVSSRKHGINSSLIRKYRIASMYMLLHYPILFRDIRALIFCFIVLFLLLLVLYASVSSSKIYTIT